MDDELQVVTFFAPCRAEVPTTMYLQCNAVVQYLQVSTLLSKYLQDIFQTDPNVTHINATADMERVIAPLLAPILVKWTSILNTKL